MGHSKCRSRGGACTLSYAVMALAPNLCFLAFALSDATAHPSPPVRGHLRSRARARGAARRRRCSFSRSWSCCTTLASRWSAAAHLAAAAACRQAVGARTPCRIGPRNGPPHQSRHHSGHQAWVQAL